MVRIEQILDSWKAIRQDTISAVEDFPAGELDYRPTPDVMTFGEIARHILVASDGLAGLLLAGEENFATPDIREKIARNARAAGPDAAALAAGLRESLEQRSAQLAHQPLEFFANMITRMDGQRLTRLEMVQMIKEHELTHRAQLFLYLRMKGIVPSTTRRRMTKGAGR
ncbi:MAG TPA: DinB family protein [Candidatus Sulfotelmatobacter sp.]|nr:DinB family protein [Candidatus Sulfotelmatobacter sp.]